MVYNIISIFMILFNFKKKNYKINLTNQKFILYNFNYKVI